MSDNSESKVLAKVRLAASSLNLVLFRNNTGAFRDAFGRLIRFGVGPNFGGGSDLIGWYRHRVRPTDVGREIAVFTALETKSQRGGRVTEAQENFIKVVKTSGGIAAVVRSENDAAEAIRTWVLHE